MENDYDDKELSDEEFAKWNKHIRIAAKQIDELTNSVFNFEYKTEVSPDGAISHYTLNKSSIFAHIEVKGDNYDFFALPNNLYVIKDFPENNWNKTKIIHNIDNFHIENGYAGSIYQIADMINGCSWNKSKSTYNDQQKHSGIAIHNISAEEIMKLYGFNNGCEKPKEPEPKPETVDSLKIKLNNAVKNENYALAAKIRDQITEKQKRN